MADKIVDLKDKLDSRAAELDAKFELGHQEFLTQQMEVERLFEQCFGEVSRCLKLDQFQLKLMDYVSHADLTTFTNEMRPMIEQSRETLGKVREESNQIKLVVRRFDEILCEKVNKSALPALQQKIEKNFPNKAQVKEQTS